jgi:hypothetical protein
MGGSIKYQDLNMENVPLFLILMCGLNRCGLDFYPRGQQHVLA